MAFIVDEETGDIECRQGDTGKIVISGIPTDKEYLLYFSIYDNDRKILHEQSARPSEGQVTFNLPPAVTDNLTVAKGVKYATYYWGIKLCYEPDDYEDTLLVGDKSIGDVNKIKVYPKIVEGTENES